MPNASHIANAKADQRLSQLIKLKQLETPDAAFWAEFEQEYRSRQLGSLVQIQPLHTRLRKACLIVARKAAPPVAAVSAVAITVVAVNNFPYLADSPSEEQSAGLAILAEPEMTSEPEPYFLVQEQVESASNELELKADGTIYQMNVLSHGHGSSDTYQLNATPVTFTYEQAKQSAGAKIISAKPDY